MKTKKLIIVGTLLLLVGLVTGCSCNKRLLTLPDQELPDNENNVPITEEIPQDQPPASETPNKPLTEKYLSESEMLAVLPIKWSGDWIEISEKTIQPPKSDDLDYNHGYKLELNLCHSDLNPDSMTILTITEFKNSKIAKEEAIKEADTFPEEVMGQPTAYVTEKMQYKNNPAYLTKYRHIEGLCYFVYSSNQFVVTANFGGLKKTPIEDIYPVLSALKIY